MKPLTYFGFGSTLAYFVVERMEFPTAVTAGVGLVAASFYAAGLWHWGGQFEHQERDHPKRQTLVLKICLIGLFFAACVLGFVNYHRLFPISKSEQQALIDRYRVALQLADVPNKTGLIELTNVELKHRGTQTYKKLKAMNNFYNANIGKLQDRLIRKEIDEPKFHELERAETERAFQEFNAETRTDAAITLRELRNRIPYESRKHIIGLPDLNPADKRHGSVSLYDSMPDKFSLYYSDLLAREIEQLAKILPNS